LTAQIDPYPNPFPMKTFPIPAAHHLKPFQN
jgi:hypothetical protein